MRWILLVAIALRCVWAFIVPVIPVSDASAYHQMALTLSQHGVYGFNKEDPSAYWPVGPSAVYAFLYSLFGSSGWVIVAFNLLTGVAVVALTIELARRWFGERVGLIAGGLMALWPTYVQFTTVPSSELMFVTLLLASLLVFDSILRDAASTSTRLAKLVLLGLLIGASSLMRPIAMLFPVVLTVVYAWRMREAPTVTRAVSSTLQFLAVVSLATTLALTPWGLRNQALFGEWVTVSTSGGVNLWMGNNPETTGFYQVPPTRPASVNEAQQDRILKQMAVDYIKSDPLAFVTRTVYKAIRLYASETIGTHWNIEGLKPRFGDTTILALKIASQAYWMVMLALFLVGCWYVARANVLEFLFHPAVAVFAASTLLYATFVIQDRYHMPTNPLMAIFAALAITRLVAWWTKTPSQDQPEQPVGSR